MPLLSNQPNFQGYPKNHIKYVKTTEDIQREHTISACKELRDEEREKRKEERNNRQREQYTYYIDLYEKYKSKDWDYVKMKLDEEERKKEEIRKARQKKLDEDNAVANMFGPISKKDMGYMFAYNDKNKWQ
jgi:hypothetical protein